MMTQTFRITYPNGVVETVTSTAISVAELANERFGLNEEQLVEFGAQIELLDKTPPELGGEDEPQADEAKDGEDEPQADEAKDGETTKPAKSRKR